jgi:hypothetical protein
VHVLQSAPHHDRARAVGLQRNACNNLLWYGRMRKQISFYSEALGKQLHGSYTVEQGTLTVYSEDRTKKIQVGTSVKEPEYLARQMLIEIERERTH